MLTGRKIKSEIKKGRIEISNFDPNRINPNSYNLTLSDHCVTYKPLTDDGIVHFDLNNPVTFSTQNITIPEDGLELIPGEIYLISSAESIHTDKYIPLITGRSTFGRMGNSVHQEAGFGDIGFNGVWTYQIKVTYHTRIYPGKAIAQVYFLTPCGSSKIKYHGSYQNAQNVMPARLK